MSTSSRFKKDKEIVAEYESQVKGKKAGVGQDACSLFLFSHRYHHLFGCASLPSSCRGQSKNPSFGINQPEKDSHDMIYVQRY